MWEWFSELNVPLWESSSAERRLDSTLAFRQSDYSATGKIDSWKVGLEFQAFEDLRLRLTQSRDVREPTFGEQFESGGGGANITDPVTKSSYTITRLSGGNANLLPEEADTLTAGFVYTPTFAGWIEGFQLSADYYEIDVSGRVNTLSAQRIIDDCTLGDVALCSLITRNTSTGLIERVLDINLNVAAGVTSGIDYEARYDLEPDFFSSQSENLRFRLFAGKTLENSITTSVYRDDLGSQQSPVWTATASLAYNVGPYGATVIGRHYDSTVNNILWREGIEVDDNTIASQTVTNLVLSYTGETAAGSNWVASLNINNILDRDPPEIATENLRGGQQTVGNQFDVFGRRYQLSLNYNF